VKVSGESRLNSEDDASTSACGPRCEDKRLLFRKGRKKLLLCMRIKIALF
jgi:hypothetical protein